MPGRHASSAGRLPVGVLLLIAGNTLCAVSFGLIVPALPVLGAGLVTSAAAISALVGVFSGMRLLFAPLAGSLCQRWGEAQVYVTGACVSGVLTALCGFLSNYPALLGVRALTGLATILYNVGASTLIIRLTPADRRGRVSGLSHTTYLLGAMIGPAVGGVLVGFSLPLPFVLCGALMVVLGLAQRVLLRREADLVAPASAAAAADAPPFRLLPMFRSPLFAAVLVSSFMLGWEVYGVRMTLVPLYATESLGLSPAVTGVAVGLCGGGSALVVLLAGRLSDRYGRRPLIVVGLSVAGGALALMGLLPYAMAFCLTAVLIGIGAGTAQPAQGAALADLAAGKPGGGKIVAAVAMSSDLGALLGPLLAGLLADSYGLGTALVASGAMMAVPVGLWLLQPALRRPALAPVVPLPASGRHAAPDSSDSPDELAA